MSDNFDGFDEDTEKAIAAVGHDPFCVSAVFAAAIHKGKTAAEAAEIEAEAVFGVGYKRDPKGRPVETGKGSRLQQTSQHKAALQKYEGRV
jgi:hypothetical protein